MNWILLTPLCLVAIATVGQDMETQMKNVSTVEQANTFIESHPSLDAELLTISSEKDTTDSHRQLFMKKTGETYSDDNHTYKVIGSTSTPLFRASYIYLDGTKLSMQSIDSLRNLIIAKYKAGTSFIDLVKEHSMDSNPKGDLGWFQERMMVNEFETAIRNHTRNDIFTVDVPSNKWHYVVLKTFDDRTTQTTTILKIKRKK